MMWCYDLKTIKSKACMHSGHIVEKSSWQYCTTAAPISLSLSHYFLFEPLLVTKTTPSDSSTTIIKLSCVSFILFENIERYCLIDSLHHSTKKKKNLRYVHASLCIFSYQFSVVHNACKRARIWKKTINWRQADDETVVVFNHAAFQVKNWPAQQHTVAITGLC